jgi:ABC-type glycerol-3-phosphate transport system substrate-binding protein
MRRRSLLRSVAAVGGLAGAAVLVKAVKPVLARQTPPLRMVWWGETEAFGIQAWVQDTLANFQAETGITVVPTLVDIDDVVDGFTRAAESGDVPDVQVLWNGIFHMQSVWKGYLMPLDGLVSRSVLKRSGATRHSNFEGKQYRVGFYSLAPGFTYNKALLDRVGLDADNPPGTWDEFLNACDRLKAAGFIPLAGGVSDGYFGDWYLTNALPQALDSEFEALQLFIGNLDWREPRYHEHWVRLEELYKHRFINDDIGQLTLYGGTSLFDSGKAGFTLNQSPSLPQSQASLGHNHVGFMVMPVFGKGKMAGQPIGDAQGFGIPTQAADPTNAARLLEFMHRKERVQAYWTLSRQLPTDQAFDSTVIDDPLMRGVMDRWFTGKHVGTIEDLMPNRFWTDAMFVASQKIVTGELTGEQSGELAHNVTEAWKAANPDTVNNYAIWGNDLAA